MVGEHHRHARLARKGDELRRAEAVVADLHGMPQVEAVHGFRQQLQEGGEVVQLELLGGSELPDQWSELFAKLSEALADEPLDRLARAGQLAPVCAEPRALDREFEPVGGLASPAPPGLGLLQAVVGRVDLDGGHLARHVGQLVGLFQVLWIERAPPGLEHPAADPHPDLTRLGHRRRPLPFRPA